MSLFWSILFVLIASLVQSVLPAVGRLSFIHLPLVSVVVVYSMLMLSFRRAVFLSLFAGFVTDSLDIGPVGGWMCAFLVVTLIFNRYRAQVFAGEVTTQALFGSLGCGAASLTLSWISGGRVMPLSKVRSMPRDCRTALMYSGGKLRAKFVITAPGQTFTTRMLSSSQIAC